MRKSLLFAAVSILSLLVFSTTALADTRCYQESATVANQSGTDGSCGLQYTGSYTCNPDQGGQGWWPANPCSNVYDGDWDTYGYGNDYGTLFINYTKPVGAINGLWQERIGVGAVTNHTLPEGCFAQDTLQFELISDYVAANGTGLCYNGTDWVQIFDYHEGPYGNSQLIREEGMWWDIHVPLIGSGNVPLVSGLLPGIIIGGGTLLFILSLFVVPAGSMEDFITRIILVIILIGILAAFF
jgi:hypothetical protein